MPRYYLHICNGSGFVEDDEGQEHPDRESACAAAILGLRDITAAELMRGEMNLGSFIEIEDENHQHVGTVHLADAVKLRRERGKRRSRR